MAKIRQISLNDALDKKYDYVVIGSAGTRETDIRRQDAGRQIYLRNPDARIFFNGYDCEGKTLDETFADDERLLGRRGLFPEYVEIAHAHNTPANARELRKRREQRRKDILYITSENSGKRSARTIHRYFNGRMLERIDVVGVKSPSDTKKNRLYEIVSDFLTCVFFAGTERGGDPEKLTQTYDSRRYGGLGKILKKALKH